MLALDADVDVHDVRSGAIEGESESSTTHSYVHLTDAPSIPHNMFPPPVIPDMRKAAQNNHFTDLSYICHILYILQIIR
jgi:hypothetical protein